MEGTEADQEVILPGVSLIPWMRKSSAASFPKAWSWVCRWSWCRTDMAQIARSHRGRQSPPPGSVMMYGESFRGHHLSAACAKPPSSRNPTLRLLPQVMTQHLAVLCSLLLLLLWLIFIILFHVNK